MFPAAFLGQISSRNPQSCLPPETLDINSLAGVNITPTLSGSGPKRIEYVPFAIAVDVVNLHDGVGHGALTRKAYGCGDIITWDDILWVGAKESRQCKSRWEWDEFLQKKVTERGKEFALNFLRLRPDFPEKHGHYGGIWKRHHIPGVVGGEQGGFFGTYTAWLNHACSPTCFLTVVRKYPVDKDGKPDRTKKRVPIRVMLRAARNIAPCEELTIGYFFAKGNKAARKEYISKNLGFDCRCIACAYPRPQSEKGFRLLADAEKILNSVNLVDRNPARIFRTAHKVETFFESLRTFDLRLVSAWVKCALTAGYHSDIGRAHWFLDTALRTVRIMEVENGPYEVKLKKWIKKPETMPGFGATTRGKSSAEQRSIVLDAGTGRSCNAILYMLEARSDEYIRLDNYQMMGEDEKSRANGRRHRILGRDVEKRVTPNDLSPFFQCMAKVQMGRGAVEEPLFHRTVMRRLMADYWVDEGSKGGCRSKKKEEKSKEEREGS